MSKIVYLVANRNENGDLEVRRIVYNSLEEAKQSCPRIVSWEDLPTGSDGYELGTRITIVPIEVDDPILRTTPKDFPNIVVNVERKPGNA